VSAVPLVRAEDIPLPRRLIAFALILLGYIFYGYAWNTVDVLRPYIRAAAGLSLQQAGLLYSAQSMGALAGALLIGQLADRHGRRLLLVVITFGYGLALLGGLVATSLTALLAQRLVLGLFLGGMFSVAVGLYVGLFALSVRGRLASVVGVMFSLGVVLQGWLGTLLLERDWTLMLWAGGLPPLFIAVLTWWAVPDDRHVVAYGSTPGANQAKAAAAAAPKLPIMELFRPEHRRRTLLITLMSALGFFAYQGFAGWVTTYLKEVRGLGGAGIGALVAWQGVGGIFGGFFWGWVADRWGRRIGAVGYFLAAAIIVAYLRAPSTLWLLTAIGAAFGFLISSSVAWGPYFAELYPPHLRSTAASIFHWGRVLSFLAPAVTAGVADAFGLTTGMMAAAAIYALCGGVWLLLPETLKRPGAAARAGPGP